MIEADLRRMRRAARATARWPLYELLHAAFAIAMRPVTGRPADLEAWADAEQAMIAAVHDLADRGAFLFFGIRHAGDLGALDVVFRLVTARGGFMLEADPLIERIMAGGARGEGWLAPHELTVADLAR